MISKRHLFTRAVPVSWLITACLVLQVFAQSATTGKIYGVVTDKDTGSPLPGANVLVVGTNKGAATDMNGRYLILNVPAGVYTLRCQFIGYSDYNVSDLKVIVGSSFEQNMALSGTVIAGEEIIVSAERPIIAKDQTGSLRVVTAEAVQNIPVRGVQNVVATSSGVVQDERGGALNIRGGRTDQTAYVIDGVWSNDPLTGNSVGSVSKSAIQELTLMTGGYNAEFGNAMSGVVNVITKSGDEKYSFNLEVLTDEFLGDGGSAFHNFGNTLYGLSFGGPVLPKNKGLIRFYESVEYNFARDRNPSWVAGDARDLAISAFPDLRQHVIDQYQPRLDRAGRDLSLEALLSARTPWASARPGLLPDYSQKSWTWNQKYTINVKQFRFTLGGNIYRADRRGGVTSYLLFNAHRQPILLDRDTQFYGRVSHTLGTRTFYDAQVSWLRSVNKQFDPFLKENFWLYGDSASTHLYGVESNPSAHSLFFATQGNRIGFDEFGFHALPDRINNFYDNRETRFWQANLNVTHQIGQHHELKFGGELRDHSLRKYQVGPTSLSREFVTLGGDRVFLANQQWVQDKAYSQLSDAERAIFSAFAARLELNEPTPEANFTRLQEKQAEIYRTANLERYGYDLFGRKLDGGFDGPKNPIIGALYFQDKVEYADFVLNFGLRFDRWDANDLVIRDFNDITNSSNGGTQAPLPNGDGEIGEDSYTDSEVYNRVSPRLGFSFPVTDKTVFYSQWGKFSQFPSLDNFYIGREYFAFRTLEAATFTNFGNPNLKPERTTSYEIGVRHQLGDVGRLQTTAYYKQIEDLIQTGLILSNYNPGGFAVFINSDYATVRGFEVSLDFRRWNNFTGSLNYSLSFAKGTGSDPSTQFNTAWQNARQPKFETPLDYDQRHTASLNVDYRLSKRPGLLSEFGVNLLYRFNSGRPYTLNDPNSNPFNRLLRPLSTVNGVYAPGNSRMDLRVDKTFRYGAWGFNLYLNATNILDQRLANGVWNSSGQPGETGYLTSETGRDVLAGYTTEQRALYTDSFRLLEMDPFNFGAPRVVQLGLQINY